MGYSSAMAKAKNQTTHNQFQKWHKKWHQENPITKTQISLSRRSNSKFLRNIRLTKKHKKGLKKTQASNAKAMSVCRSHQESVNPRWPSPRCQMSLVAHSAILLSLLTPSLGTGLEATWPRVVGSASQSSRIKPRSRPQLQFLGSSSAQALVKAPTKGFCLQREGRWAGVTHPHAT